jgi:hypothetical protein
MGDCMKGYFLSLFFTCILLLASACGREAAPFPPEKVSPKAVERIQFKADDKKVDFSWLAPKSNERGKPLKEMDGYHIYKAQLVDPETVEQLKDDDFELLTTLPDNTIDLLNKRKEEATAAGKSQLRVSLSKEERTVNFSDQALELNKTYVYKIAPFNHKWVDGASPQLIKVIFKGAVSEISLVDNTQGLNALEDTTELTEDPQ